MVSYLDTVGLNKKHRRTLEAIYDEPVRSSVRWDDVESLLRALGADLDEGRGSRIRAHLGGVRAVFHRPHPTPELSKGAVRSVRRFLIAATIM